MGRCGGGESPSASRSAGAKHASAFQIEKSYLAFAETGSGQTHRQLQSTRYCFAQVKHLAAEAHVSGTATFLADIGVPQGTLHAQFVTSTRAHANIIGLDSTACYEIPARKHLFYCTILYSTKFSRIFAKIDSGQQTHRNIETKTRHTRFVCLQGFIRLLDGGSFGDKNYATLDGYGELLAFDGTVRTLLETEMNAVNQLSSFS